MDVVDRFAVLRQALPQDRYGDEEVTAIADRCCELALQPTFVLVETGQQFEEWLVVVDGQIEVLEHGRRWVAGGGAIVQPCGPGGDRRSVMRLAALTASIVLLVVDLGELSRP